MSVSPGEQQRLLFAQVGLSGPAAGWLADLGSIVRDLQFAKECASGYSQLMGNGDTLVPHALWNAGVMSYRRAFNAGRGHLVDGGSRPRLDQHLVGILTAEQRAAHDEIYQTANQHVAHRVDSREGATVSVFLYPPPYQMGIAAIGDLGVHMIGPMPELANKLVEIVGVFLQVLKEERERSSRLVMAQIVAECELAELYGSAAVESVGGA